MVLFVVSFSEKAAKSSESCLIPELLREILPTGLKPYALDTQKIGGQYSDSTGITFQLSL